MPRNNPAVPGGRDARDAVTALNEAAAAAPNLPLPVSHTRLRAWLDYRANEAQAAGRGHAADVLREACAEWPPEGDTTWDAVRAHLLGLADEVRAAGR